MWNCKKCGGLRFSSATGCHCKPHTIIDADGEEHTIQAMDRDDAAMKYAERSNVECDYYLMNHSVVIKVDGVEFEISAEPDIHYSVNEI